MLTESVEKLRRSQIEIPYLFICILHLFLFSSVYDYRQNYTLFIHITMVQDPNPFLARNYYYREGPSCISENFHTVRLHMTPEQNCQILWLGPLSCHQSVMSVAECTCKLWVLLGKVICSTDATSAPFPSQVGTKGQSWLLLPAACWQLWKPACTALSWLPRATSLLSWYWQRVKFPHCLHLAGRMSPFQESLQAFLLFRVHDG